MENFIFCGVFDPLFKLTLNSKNAPCKGFDFLCTINKKLLFEKFINLMLDSHHLKRFVLFASMKALKNNGKCFLFHLKITFCS